MLAAIAGDIIGSYYERYRNATKSTDFKLFHPETRFTDDTVMTLAVALWLLNDPEHRHETLVQAMLKLGRRYPHAGYGGKFRIWLASDNPQPYNSFGNGSAMRVSPVGLYASSLDEALALARVTAEVSHNHPEAIRGAQVTAGCVYLSRIGKSKDEIREFVLSKGYTFDATVREMRPSYRFDATCQGSVPQSVQCFLEGRDFEHTVRLAISMGGDADTMAAIAGAIAAPHGVEDEEIARECRRLLTPELREIMDRFERMTANGNAHQWHATADRIRGSLLGGAAGDALGYTVEFKSLDEIRRQFGADGITRYVPDPDTGKAEPSDDTQMTLFTACGLLSAADVGSFDGDFFDSWFVKEAYLDWFVTQGYRIDRRPCTWIGDIPELNVRRAPGNTCLWALQALANDETPRNNSKGCGGVMRVAPVGLLAAAHHLFHSPTPGDAAKVAIAGGKIAQITHKHPMGIFPAAMLAEIIYRIVISRQTPSPDDFREIVAQALCSLDAISGNIDMQPFSDLINRALALAADTSTAPADAIARLGKGWVADEALAIAIYAVARCYGDFEATIIAAVNHSGDSDSTGAIAGNIAGALYGESAIPEHFKDNLQLKPIILTLADDLLNGALIAQGQDADTPERTKYYNRYIAPLED